MTSMFQCTNNTLKLGARLLLFWPSSTCYYCHVDNGNLVYNVGNTVWPNTLSRPPVIDLNFNLTPTYMIKWYRLY